MNRGSDRGFTLLEVLLAAALAAVMAAAVFGTFAAGRDASRKGELSGEADQIVRQALDRIAADLRLARRPTAAYDTGFLGKDGGGQAPAEARDTLDFLTASPLRMPNERPRAEGPAATRTLAPVAGATPPRPTTPAAPGATAPASGAAPAGIDLARVRYEIDDDPNTPEQGLVRREQRFLTSESTDDNALLETLEIAPEIVGLNFRYYQDAALADVWDSRQSDSLPPAVEVTLALRLERYGEVHERTVKTIVRCVLVPPIGR